MMTHLAKVMAKRPRLKPYPGWYLGLGEWDRGLLPALRREIWKQVKEPFLLAWLGGLYIYAYPKDESDRCIFLTGCFEPSGFYVIEKLLKPGMTFVDVGANQGLYTLFVAKHVGEYGVVVSIEPSNREFKRLKKNLEVNRLTNVRLLQTAVSNCSCEADLLIAEEERAGHNTLGAFGYNTVLHSKQRTAVETLDDVLRRENLQRVDIIKMDIEGAEFLALQGACQTLERFHPILLLELSDRNLQHQNCSSKQIWYFLIKRGYRIYAFEGDTGLPVPAEKKQYFDGENILAIYGSNHVGGD